MAFSSSSLDALQHSKKRIWLNLLGYAAAGAAWRCFFSEEAKILLVERVFFFVRLAHF